MIGRPAVCQDWRREEDGGGADDVDDDVEENEVDQVLEGAALAVVCVAVLDEHREKLVCMQAHTKRNPMKGWEMGDKDDKDRLQMNCGYSPGDNK